MTYGPEDLKRVSDELLGDFQPSPLLRQRILSACAAGSTVKRRRCAPAGRYLTCAAAALLVCAIAAIGFGWAMQSRPEGTSAAHLASAGRQVQAISGAAQPVSGAFVQTGSEQNQTVPQKTVSPASTAWASAQVGEDHQSMTVFFEDAGPVTFFIEQSDAGLYGVTDGNGLWVVSPEFDFAVFSDDGTVLLQRGEDSSVLEPAELWAFAVQL